MQTKDRWKIAYTIDHPPMSLDKDASFVDVLYSRRTNRCCSPATLAEVLSLIRSAMLITETGTQNNMGRLRKVTISAGALHPIEVLIVAGPEVLEPLLYIDENDIFGAVKIRSARRIEQGAAELAAFLPNSHGHHIMFVANRRHVEQAYQNPASLLWRDAGACLQTFSMICASVGYSFVPLGQMGEALLAEIETPHSDYVAVGTALIGRAPTRAERPSA